MRTFFIYITLVCLGVFLAAACTTQNTRPPVAPADSRIQQDPRGQGDVPLAQPGGMPVSEPAGPVTVDEAAFEKAAKGEFKDPVQKGVPPSSSATDLPPPHPRTKR